ncbi:type II secretion system GspH family protein [Shewanella sp. A25]|nr:type II secretion system GspH family protein [Shewanella shenzhenensis]
MPLPTKRLIQHSQLGFTLVEMVTVMLILGILVVGVSSFIIFGTRIFVESSSVDQVLSQSRFAVERMTRDFREALPSSLRITTGSNFQCIEFVPIEASTTYLTMPIAPEPVATTGKVITDSAVAIRIGQYAWIYPLLTADVYDMTRLKRAEISAVTTVVNEAELAFSSNMRFAEASPRQRIYFASTAVSYCFEEDVASNGLALKRYTGYGILVDQPEPANMGTGVLMAQSIANNLGDNTDLPMMLTPSTLVNNAIVHLQPSFNVNGETFQYRHQVQVANVP